MQMPVKELKFNLEYYSITSDKRIVFTKGLKWKSWDIDLGGDSKFFKQDEKVIEKHQEDLVSWKSKFKTLKEAQDKLEKAFKAENILPPSRKLTNFNHYVLEGNPNIRIGRVDNNSWRIYTQEEDTKKLTSQMVEVLEAPVFSTCKEAKSYLKNFLQSVDLI